MVSWLILAGDPLQSWILWAVTTLYSETLLSKQQQHLVIIITSLPKVIWEEDCVAALWHTYAVEVPISYHGTPEIRPQKYPFPMDRSPNPTTCLIPGPVRPMMPNGIRIRSAIFHNALDRPMHRPRYQQTDKSSTGKFDDYRPLRYESDAA